MERITSVHNNKIVEISKLKKTKYRKETGLFTVDGRKLTYELIRCGLKPVYCFVLESAKIDEIPNEIDRDIIYIVPDNIMSKLSGMSSSPDMLTVAKIPQQSSYDAQDDFILALDKIQDPSNLGAILRSAEAFGVKTVILSENCCDYYSPKTLRGAMGSVFRLNIITANLCEFLKYKRMHGYEIIGTGLNKNYRTIDSLCEFNKKVLVIGNEGNGISDEIQKECCFGMYIPMTGSNESLNAAVAASIIMWENQRQTNERK